MLCMCPLIVSEFNSTVKMYLKCQKLMAVIYLPMYSYILPESQHRDKFPISPKLYNVKGNKQTQFYGFPHANNHMGKSFRD
jgi:hypothetical protein